MEMGVGRSDPDDLMWKANSIHVSTSSRILQTKGDILYSWGT